MAIDGSFSLESALERFLALFPKLGGLPHFDYLAKKVSWTTFHLVLENLMVRS